MHSQSFFMADGYPSLLLHFSAPLYSAWVKLPTVVSGSLCTEPYSYSRLLSSCNRSIAQSMRLGSSQMSWLNHALVVTLIVARGG
jgi:hypothetical protein